ncbi:hypothetical protein [Arthrobacter sp. 35W]|uniref:hypothetical protein n=1 Tax=Arthrobacter sp. 35W TaxID=1132441 RepID=UPI0004288E7B|nr:hypothetical protein [Arthrobacter sp. 35W]
MRKKADWLDITFQFTSFALVCLLLSVARWPFLVNIVLAFGVSMGLSWAYGRFRQVRAARKAEPKRMRVISVQNVED